MCKLSNENDVLKYFYLNIVIQLNAVCFKITSTEWETILTLLIAVELGYWNSRQLIGCSSLNIFECAKIISLKVNFQSCEEEKRKLMS